MHVGQLVVFEQEVLDLSRVDVLPASNDHVLRSAHDRNRAVLVHYGDVAEIANIWKINYFVVKFIRNAFTMDEPLVF